MTKTALAAYNLTPSQENYLERILELSEKSPARVSDIAQAAGVRLSSVTKGVSRLVECGLVRHESYGAVEITPAGLEAAQSVARRDRCLSDLLRGVLGMAPEAAEAETCRLEHLVSEEVLERLETLVDYAQGAQSARWLRGLHERLQSIPKKRESAGNVRVGEGGPHVERQIRNRKRKEVVQ